MKKRTIALLIIFLTLAVSALIVLLIHRKGENTARSALIQAIDANIEDEGICQIDLAVVFADYEWDTCLLFESGNPRELEDAFPWLGYIEDGGGIALIKNGEPVVMDMSHYDYNLDRMPVISYVLSYGESAEGQHYKLINNNDALVYARKQKYHKGYIYFVSIE